MSCSFSSTFFTGTCGSGNNPDHFKDLAEKTSGQVIRLTTNGELKQLSGLTGSVLGGSNTVSVGSNESRRKKRSASHSKHSIILDDSIEDVTFSINTENRYSSRCHAKRSKQCCHNIRENLALKGTCVSDQKPYHGNLGPNDSVSCW